MRALGTWIGAAILSVLAGAGVGAASLSGGGSDQQIDWITVGPWEGGAYQSAADGSIYCAVWDDYGAGTGIWIGWDSTGLYLNITDPDDFYFQEGQTFWTNVRLDNIVQWDAEAYVSYSDTINIDFANRRDLIDPLRYADTIFLDGLGVWYTLVGSDEAVQAVENCYWTYN
jgi:hypothetical protein